MFMENPKVDFIELQLDNIIATSSGSSMAICQKAGDDYVECTGGAAFNYPSNPTGEDCGGDLDNFDY